MNHLTILGDFGTGKSCCAMELTVRLLERGGARMPLFFSLRDYQHVETLQSIVTKGMTEKYGILNFNYPAFLRLLEEGRLLVIFDAFDELATLSERWATITSLRRLNEAVRGRSKVILTCRKHYFTTQAAEREGIAGSMPPRGGELFAEGEGRRNYAIIDLEPFSQEQIREFVHCGIIIWGIDADRATGEDPSGRRAPCAAGDLGWVDFKAGIPDDGCFRRNHQPASHVVR